MTYWETAVFPLGVRLRLELLNEQRLSGGTVCLRHAVLPVGTTI